MSRRVLVALMATVFGCSSDAANSGDGFSDAEWIKIRTHSPLPETPADPTNKYADRPQAATLGQRVFFDKGYAGPILAAAASDGSNGGLGQAGDTGKVACASCHDPSSPGLDDRRTHPNSASLGVNWTTRNSPPLTNVAFYKLYNWAADKDSLWMQASVSHESAVNFGGNRLAYAHYLYKKYRTDYDALFPTPIDPALDPAAADAARFPAAGKPKAAMTDPDGPWELMTDADRKIVNTIISNVGKSIAAYERLLVSRNAPFDRYVAGDTSAIDAAAKRGLKLFIGKAACDACHQGAFFTDQQFHNDGVPQMVEHLPATDAGMFTDVPKLLSSAFNGAGAYSDDPVAGKAKLDALGMPTDTDKGKFRTKNLRSALPSNAPYMHNGSKATLKDVVLHYNDGGAADGFEGTKDPKMVPLNLTPQEIDDLVAFLGTLGGDPIPPALAVDTSAP